LNRLNIHYWYNLGWFIDWWSSIYRIIL